MPERIVRPLARGAGVFLLLVPFFPVRWIFGRIHAPGYVPPVDWLLGLAVFGTIAWLATLLLGDRFERFVPRERPAVEARPGRPVIAVAAPVLAGILGLVSWFVFGHQPLLVDGVAQLFQARIFAAGMIAAPAPPEPAFFATLNMVIGDRGWFAQYPPGHSMALTAGVVAGVPWLVPIVMTMGTLVVLDRFVDVAYDRTTANLTVALTIACPFLWFMGASFMNHVPALFFLALFLYGFARWERGGTIFAALAGGALGAAFLCRPLTAIAFGLPFGWIAATRAVRGGDRKGAAVGAVTFALVAGVYLVWNAATTGDPWLPGYVALWGESHGLGFHETPWGEVHTPLAGVRNALVDLSLLSVHLFEWPVPALLPVGLFFAMGWSEPGWDRRLLVVFFGLSLAYVFYWHRDAYLGPRYLYSGLACLLPLSARGLSVGWRRLSGVVLPGPVGVRPLRVSTFGAFLVLSSTLYAAGWGIPQRFILHPSGLGVMKADLRRQADEKGVGPGIVFVATSWGNRLLAELRGSGVSAARAERVYRRADHCAVQIVIDRAREEGWPVARITRALDSLVRLERELVDPGLNGDPTLRLDPSRTLAPECVLELRHDREGTAVYAPHLLGNDPGLDGPWIFARDLRERNDELLARYPGRQAWRYRPGGFEPVAPLSER